MNKVCCVGEAGVCPKSSSCSMVLRSACSHRHSRESSTVKENLQASPNRKSKRSSGISRKESSNGTLNLESLESSFKALALKSAEKTYTLLKERFYNSFDFSETTDQKLFETSSVHLPWPRGLQFSQLSASDNSSVFNNINISHKECSSDYSSATESDINSSESLMSTSHMSKPPGRRFTRSALSSVRSLSGSEGEDDIEVKKIVKHGRLHKTDNYLFFNNSSKSLSERQTNSQDLSSNHNYDFETQQNYSNNYKNKFGGGDSLTYSTESSHVDRSAVQYSLFDRCRWFLWRCTYLKIIGNFCFDVWFLSRIHNYRKYKVIFLLLLPLLLFLIWGTYQHNSVSYESLSQTLNSFKSPVYDFLSSPFSLFGYFIQKEEVVTEPEIVGTSCSPGLSTVITFLPSFTGIYETVSGWFVRSEDDAPLDMETEYEAGYQDKMSGSLYQKSEDVFKSFQPSREEMKILATEVLKDEMKSLKEFIKTNIHGTEAEKLKKEQKLQNEIKNLRLEFQALSGKIGRVESEIKMQNEKSETTERVLAVTNEYKSDIDHLNLKLKTIETKLGVLEQLKSCCKNQWSPEDFIALLEKHLITAFRNVVDGDSDPGSKYYFFNQWLNSKFFSHEKLMQEINTALRRQSLRSENAVNYDNVIKVVESTVVKHVDSIKKNLTDKNMFSHSSFSNDYFSEDKIKKIVKEAIMLYDADKTGQVDYALESGGGSVLGTRCSETYVEKYGKIAFFGVPIWTSSNSPRTAIQPDVQPGRCWAFKGSEGFLVLELSATIYPTGFTLEHIPVSLSPSGSIDSAPKNFSVWGLESEKDSKGQLLGEYTYDINGEPLQYFEVQTSNEQPYNYVELKILSNHGNMEYTCLYRFRVHGQRDM